ncbi:Transferase [Macleaya cordata]|uniref:Transferase n=1 Tax=Macleaya cordata TaxID=56857 RepID=A0A200R8P1_MACCD|nr:Transferase [Macleaya cordata]
MDMKVEVVSRETIKPSCPTPHYHRTFNLSFLDQISPSLYTPYIFFYNNNNSNNNDNHIMASSSSRRRDIVIKKSLAETLTRFYPLAGRIKDADSLIVDCNDDGVDYLEARVNNCALSQVIQHPDVRELEMKFLPFDPYFDDVSEISNKSSSGFNSKALLAVQVNIFEEEYCGGMAIGVCMSHKIADALSLFTFINQWAATAREATEQIKSPFFGLSYLFPAPRYDLMGFIQSPPIMKEEIVTKRFVFGASKIADLQKQINRIISTKSNDGGGSKDHDHEYNKPTSVEVVSAFIWRCFMDVNRAKKELGTAAAKFCAASQSVNMRNRMVPPLPKTCFGNMVGFTVALSTFCSTNGEAEKINQYPYLVSKLRESINKIDDVHIREMQTTNAFFNSMKLITESIISGETVLIHISSFCRFPVYEANFGWGKPIFASPCKLAIKNLVYLMDTGSGDGIEAWVSLTKEDMAEFEHDKELLAFVSVGRSNL